MRLNDGEIKNSQEIIFCNRSKYLKVVFMYLLRVVLLTSKMHLCCHLGLKILNIMHISQLQIHYLALWLLAAYSQRFQHIIQMPFQRHQCLMVR